MDNIQLIIPMSGIGKRFIDAGYNLPKPLIEVDGKTIIEHVVNLFPGVTDVTFICNEVHKENNIINILKNIVPTCKIYFVSNENRKGPVDAVLQISEFINNDKETIISYCDYGSLWDFEKFINIIRENNYDGSIPCYKGFHPHMLGSDNYAFCREENNILLEIKEKESFTNNKMNEFASNGTYFFKSGSLLKKYFKKLIELDINLKGEYYVSLVYNLLVNDGLKINIFEIEKMLQWGTPYDLEVYKGWSKYFKDIKSDSTYTDIIHDDVTLILPMAGKGSRFKEEGYLLPKPILHILPSNNMMFVEAVNVLPNTNKKIFVTLNQHNTDYNVTNIIKSSFDNTEVIELNETTEGQACTCNLAINKFNVLPTTPILISACDNSVYYDKKKYKELYDDENIDIIVWTFRNNQASKTNPNAYCWLDVDDEGFIKEISNKNFIYDDPLKTHAIIGTMFFRKCEYFTEGFNYNYNNNIRTNNEFYVDDVLNYNIKNMGLKVKVFEVDHYICWGTPNDYKTYNYWEEYFNKIEKK